MKAEHKYILIVERIPSVRRIFAGVLRSAGYFTLEAETIEEALNYLERIKIDLVFCDFNLLPENGMDFLLNIRKKRLYGSLPFVLAVSDTAMVAQNKMSLPDACRFILKPLEAKDILKKAEYLVGWKEHSSVSSANYSFQ